jgi:hypothetical protein
MRGNVRDMSNCIGALKNTVAEAEIDTTERERME